MDLTTLLIKIEELEESNKQLKSLIETLGKNKEIKSMEIPTSNQTILLGYADVLTSKDFIINYDVPSPSGPERRQRNISNKFEYPIYVQNDIDSIDFSGFMERVHMSKIILPNLNSLKNIKQIDIKNFKIVIDNDGQIIYSNTNNHFCIRKGRDKIVYNQKDIDELLQLIKICGDNNQKILIDNRELKQQFSYTVYENFFKL